MADKRLPSFAGQTSGASDLSSDLPAGDSNSKADSTTKSFPAAEQIPGELPATCSLPTDIREDSPTAPSVLGRYRLEAVLGRGGMGEVWRAFDPHLSRHVALKVLRSGRALGTASIHRFLDEGRHVAQLDHPGIIKVFDCGFESGVCFLISEYITGGTLADQINQSSVTSARAADLVAQVADAAQFAHRAGIVHRDIKPANILMRTDEQPVLADFGLAVTEAEQLRETAGTLGTYAYMSPEQLRGESHLVDGRADIYSLGVVLYQLLTGRLPFLAETPDQYREMVLRRDPRPPRSLQEDIPPDLEAICLKCLARDPSARYTTAADLAAALRAVCRTGHKFRGSAPILAAVAASLLVGAAIVWRPGREAAPDSRAPVSAAPGASSQVAAAVHSAAPSELVIDTLLVSEHPLTDGSCVWEVTAPEDSLQFMGDKYVLFALGTMGKQPLSFSVEIEQSRWTGGLGLFWGLAPSQRKTNYQKLESFTLYPLIKGKYQLCNSVLEFPNQALLLAGSNELSRVPLEPLQKRSFRMAFEFNEGRLIKLLWDGEEVTEMLTQRQMAHPDSDANQGIFGLYAHRTQGRFTRPVMNGKSVRFQRQPSR